MEKESEFVEKLKEELRLAEILARARENRKSYNG